MGVKKFPLPNVKYVIYILTFLIIINSVILFINLKKNQASKEKLDISAYQTGDFLNNPAPDFEGRTFDNKLIRLYQYPNDIIIMRFSNFYFDDLPYLLFLV
jgi:hypothetical protein